jgi:type I restriction enzyme R subunit
MSFNELNSVEHYIVQQLSGVNLNHRNWADEQVPYGFQWAYKSAAAIARGVNDVLVVIG